MYHISEGAFQLPGVEEEEKGAHNLEPRRESTIRRFVCYVLDCPLRLSAVSGLASQLDGWSFQRHLEQAYGIPGYHEEVCHAASG